MSLRPTHATMLRMSEEPVVRSQPVPDRVVDGPSDWSDLGDLISAVHDLHDALARGHLPANAVAEARAAVERATAALRPHAADVFDRPYGLLRQRPDRGTALVPPIHVETLTETELRATVTLSPFYVGGLGAAHGGVMGLVFDGAFGRVARTGFKTLSRTAFLKVDYRQVTPLDKELQIHAWLERVDGRKRFMRGTLHDGQDLLVDSEALFVALLAHHK